MRYSYIEDQSNAEMNYYVIDNEFKIVVAKAINGSHANMICNALSRMHKEVDADESS